MVTLVIGTIIVFFLRDIENEALCDSKGMEYNQNTMSPQCYEIINKKAVKHDIIKIKGKKYLT